MAKSCITTILLCVCAFGLLLHVEAWRFLAAEHGQECKTDQECSQPKNLTCGPNSLCECKKDEETGDPWYYHEELKGCLESFRNHVFHQHENEHNHGDSGHDYQGADEDNHNEETQPQPDPSKNLPLAESIIGNPCSTNYECSSVLGPHSRCNSNKCECHDVTTGKWEAGYYEGQCYLKKKLGEPCVNPNECKIVDKNMECSADHQNPGHSKCTCPQGKQCSNSGNGILTPITFIILALGAVRVIV